METSPRPATRAGETDGLQPTDRRPEVQENSGSGGPADKDHTGVQAPGEVSMPIQPARELVLAPGSEALGYRVRGGCVMWWPSPSLVYANLSDTNNGPSGLCWAGCHGMAALWQCQFSRDVAAHEYAKTFEDAAQVEAWQAQAERFLPEEVRSV